MKIESFLFFLIFTLATPFFSESKEVVVISGSAPDYRGYEIVFHQYADAISKEKIELASFKIEQDGSFKTTVNLDATTWCFAEFDGYRASLYLQSGQSYQLVFPPLKKVPDSQKRNPFFEAEEISFALKNSHPHELNRQIQEFERAYLKEESRYFNQIYHQRSMAAVDSLRSHLQKLFPETDHVYFETYKFYRTAFAEFALHQGKSDQFIKTYFIDQKPDLSIPPCSKLFSQLFTDYFSFEGNQIRGNDFKRLVAQANLSGLEEFLIAKNNWNSNLSRLIILQSINDAYFQGQFSPKSLLRLLDQIITGNWASTKKAIANRLKEKLTYLQAGSQAPNFYLTDFDGKKHQLSDFQDRYIYLNFTRVANPVCRQHLDQLKKMDENLKDELHILNLITPEEAGKKELITQQNWTGTFFVVDEKTADAYRVSNFPKAYLIDKNRKLVLSPAPNPLDGFEQRFIDLLKQKRLEELRNQDR